MTLYFAVVGALGCHPNQNQSKPSRRKSDVSSKLNSTTTTIFEQLPKKPDERAGGNLYLSIRVGLGGN